MIYKTTGSTCSNEINSIPETDNWITQNEIMPFIFTLQLHTLRKGIFGLPCTGFTLTLIKTKVWTGYHHHVIGQDVVSCVWLLGYNWKGLHVQYWKYHGISRRAFEWLPTQPNETPFYAICSRWMCRYSPIFKGFRIIYKCCWTLCWRSRINIDIIDL